MIHRRSKYAEEGLVSFSPTTINTVLIHAMQVQCSMESTLSKDFYNTPSNGGKQVNYPKSANSRPINSVF